MHNKALKTPTLYVKNKFYLYCIVDDCLDRYQLHKYPRRSQASPQAHWNIGSLSEYQTLKYQIIIRISDPEISDYYQNIRPWNIGLLSEYQTLKYQIIIRISDHYQKIRPWNIRSLSEYQIIIRISDPEISDLYQNIRLLSEYPTLHVVFKKLLRDPYLKSWKQDKQLIT